MESDDVTINVTIAVRVIAPEGVMTHTDTEYTNGMADGNRINGVRADNTTQNNGNSTSWSTFYTTNFPSYNNSGREFNYDANSGLWIHEGGTGTITRNMKIRANPLNIYDDWKEMGKDGGFSYSRTNDKEVLIDEGGDVYLFYTVTLRKIISITGTVTLSNKSTSAVVTPYLYTTGPNASGKGISGNRVKGYAYGTPGSGPYNGSFGFRIEDYDDPTQLWFIPTTVRESTSGTPFRDDSFGFESITVHNTDIKDLSFTTTTEN
jgi:hypothetical protein